jgi:hypothetical protein
MGARVSAIREMSRKPLLIWTGPTKQRFRRMTRLRWSDYWRTISCSSPGPGKVYTKQDLVNEARSGRINYEQQDDTDQNVRVWGNTAVITARLRAKGSEAGMPFEYTLWFSDTYVKTPQGWKYVFGQSSLPLPKR